ASCTASACRARTKSVVWVQEASKRATRREPARWGLHHPWRNRIATLPAGKQGQQITHILLLLCLSRGSSAESSPVWRGRLGGSGDGGEGAVGVGLQVVDQDPADGAVAARAGIVAGTPRPGAAEPPRSQPQADPQPV